MTNQSDSAKKKCYRREFGPTKVFSNDPRKAEIKSKEIQKEAKHQITEDGEKNFNC